MLEEQCQTKSSLDASFEPCDADGGQLSLNRVARSRRVTGQSNRLARQKGRHQNRNRQSDNRDACSELVSSLHRLDQMYHFDWERSIGDRRRHTSYN